MPQGMACVYWAEGELEFLRLEEAALKPCIRDADRGDGSKTHRLVPTAPISLPKFVGVARRQVMPSASNARL